MSPFLVQTMQTKSLPATAEEDSVPSEGADSDRFSFSNSSFLANEKLMSVDSMNSDITGVCFLVFLQFFIVSRLDISLIAKSQKIKPRTCLICRR